MDINERVGKLVKKYRDDVIAIRRDIHKHPELGYQEVRTAGIVAEKLRSLGFDEVKTGIAKTGVMGILKGKNSGKTLLLRADMDALPIQEANVVDYASCNAGVMHACGHDAHTANLIGVAMILSELRDSFNGTIKFIFQPAEEGGGGGREMIKEGILDNPKVDAAMGLHVYPHQVGTIATKYGCLMAYSDAFTINIKGRNAHTSRPEKGVDAIVIAGHIISCLESVIPRCISPFENTTFTIGKIHGGSAINVVCDQVVMEGMMRNISSESREKLITKLKEVSQQVGASFGGEVEFIIKAGYPSVDNNKMITDIVKQVVDENNERLVKTYGYKGKNLFSWLEKPVLGAEDFGFITHKVPSCYFFLGLGEMDASHTPNYDIDENLFDYSLNILSCSAIKYLNS